MRVLVAALTLALAAGAARAEGEAAGDFDYYILALSWSPTWCALEGDGRRAPECAEGADLGFVLHGLWPQYEEDGWPSYCRTGQRDPSRTMTEAMSDIMGSDGLAWYQWKKHGRCTGLSARSYYALMRAAYASVKMPKIFDMIDTRLKVPAEVIEGAFLEANPGLARDQITVTCDAGRIAEVRLCLDRDLSPRSCGSDVIRDCQMQDAVLDPLR